MVRVAKSLQTLIRSKVKQCKFLNMKVEDFIEVPYIRNVILLFLYLLTDLVKSHMRPLSNHNLYSTGLDEIVMNSPSHRDVPTEMKRFKDRLKLAPLNTPLKRRLQTLAASTAFMVMTCGGLIGFTIILYLLFYTRYWPEALFYLCWMWMLDTKAIETGQRSSDWVRAWTWWRYVKEYFPTRLERVPWVDFDPKKNYLLCCYPHGLLPMGVFTSFATSANGFQELFPNHIPYVMTLKLNFFFPLLRDLAMAMGMCSSSSQTLNRLLSNPDGGKAVALAVGGAQEAYFCRPGQYRIFLKRRKGFIKIALQNGSPIVPVFSFGETSVFDQLELPKGSILRWLQDWLKKVTGIALIIPAGRGHLHYGFGMVPFRTPVSTIIGKPIEVEKTANPTQEQIEDLHARFTKELINLFEEQKYNYLPNAKNVNLIIE